MPTPVLADGVTFRYSGGRVGLQPLDLRIDPGEVVVVLGPNGSGKSTLLRLLATDLRPSGGVLKLLGVNAAPPSHRLRRRISWVPDRPVHLPVLTGRENLAFFAGLDPLPSKAPLLPPDEEARSKCRDSWLRAFGLGPVAHVPVAEYSFGMSRRLALAEALATLPDLLLLDEPTVGLDPEGTAVLAREVGKAAARHAAVVVATNEVRDAPEWATRILFLDEGTVIEDASPRELRARIPGGTHIRVGLEAAPGAPEQEARPWATAAGHLPGVTLLEAGADHLLVRARDGSRTLPVLLQALVDEGARIREVKLREPDLGDLFQDLTGRGLGPDSDGPGGAAHGAELRHPGTGAGAGGHRDRSGLRSDPDDSAASRDISETEP